MNLLGVHGVCCMAGTAVLPSRGLASANNAALRVCLPVLVTWPMSINAGLHVCEVLADGHAEVLDGEGPRALLQVGGLEGRRNCQCLGSQGLAKQPGACTQDAQSTRLLRHLAPDVK